MIHVANGRQYRVASGLNAFQLDLYVHLIEWKWRNITTEPGFAGRLAYDAILPDAFKSEEHSPLIYEGVAEALAAHRRRNKFRIHRHYYHMASSQAANINLFLPLLLHPEAASMLRQINPEFASLATDHLDQGYCIEFWGGNYDATGAASRAGGPLGDKSATAGTDSDIAIAYRNHASELCLWLIEHKLTEKEFTECGGFKSKGRDARHDCGKTLAGLLQDKAACYYHSKQDRQFKYWDITDRHQAFFVHHDLHAGCPFKGGMNQLWRNQLLGLAIEDDAAQPYQQVRFSVVKHPRNAALNATLGRYQALVNRNPQFSIFDSDKLVLAAESINDPALSEWARWYRNLYKL